MARDILNKIDRADGKVKRKCDSGCRHFRFPHLETACILSGVYSVKQGEGCYIYEEAEVEDES